MMSYNRLFNFLSHKSPVRTKHNSRGDGSQEGRRNRLRLERISCGDNSLNPLQAHTASRSLAQVDDIVPREKIILDPPELVQGLQHIQFGLYVECLHAHDDVRDGVFHPAQQEIDVAVLDKQGGPVLAMLQAGIHRARVHLADHVDVCPEFALRRPVVVRHQPHQIPLEEVLAELDIRVVAVQILDFCARAGIAGAVCGLCGREGRRGDVEAQEVVVDGVDDVVDDGCKNRLAGLDQWAVFRWVPDQEVLQVLHPRGQVDLDELCVDVLHLCCLCEGVRSYVFLVFVWLYPLQNCSRYLSSMIWKYYRQTVYIVVL